MDQDSTKSNILLDTVRRVMYITSAILDRLGRTQHCPTCEDRGSQHTVECSTSVEMMHAEEDFRSHVA